jgi:hypothetical protein
MASYRHHAWQNLVGVVVEIRRAGEVIRRGLVETAMADSSALWLAAEGLERRVIIEAAERYEVWVEPRLLEGSFAYRMAPSALQRR